MAFFTVTSVLLGWPVISYALFAAGIAAIVLTDFAAGDRWKSGVGICIALPEPACSAGRIPPF